MNWFRGFPSLPAIIGLVTGSALTLLLWQHADQRAGLESERGFAQRVEHAVLALERFNADIFSMLRSVRTLAERDGLTSQAFAATVSAANQRHFASGLQYVGFLAARAAAGSDCAPYAPGAAGNIATQSVVDLVEGLGFETGIDRNKLEQATAFAIGLRSSQ